MSLNILSMVYEQKRWASLFLSNGLGKEDSRSYEQGFLNGISMYMEDLRKSKRLPDQTEDGLELERYVAEWAEKSAKLQGNAATEESTRY